MQSRNGEIFYVIIVSCGSNQQTDNCSLLNVCCWGRLRWKISHEKKQCPWKPLVYWVLIRVIAFPSPIYVQISIFIQNPRIKNLENLPSMKHIKSKQQEKLMFQHKVLHVQIYVSGLEVCYLLVKVLVYILLSPMVCYC